MGVGNARSLPHCHNYKHRRVPREQHCKKGQRGREHVASVGCMSPCHLQESRSNNTKTDTHTYLAT